VIAATSVGDALLGQEATADVGRLAVGLDRGRAEVGRCKVAAERGGVGLEIAGCGKMRRAAPT